MHHLNQGILGLGDPIRWMIRRDMPVVLAIEAASDRRPWNEGDFRRHLALPHCIGQVAEPDGRVVGFQVYSLTKTGIHLHRFGVDPESRRQGVGSRLLTRLMAKLSSQRRTVVTAYLREANLAGQLFLRAQRFRAVAIVRGFFDGKNDTNEDAYLFEYRFGQSTEGPH